MKQTAKVARRQRQWVIELATRVRRVASQTMSRTSGGGRSAMARTDTVTDLSASSAVRGALGPVACCIRRPK